MPEELWVLNQVKVFVEGEPLIVIVIKDIIYLQY